MLRAVIGVRRAQLLAGGLHFHRGLAGQICRPFAQDLRDFAHGGKLLRVADVLVTVLAADAATWLLASLPGVALALPLALLGILGVLGLLAVLAFLGVA